MNGELKADFSPYELCPVIYIDELEIISKEVKEQFQLLDYLKNNYDNLSNADKFKCLFLLYRFILTYEDIMKLVNLKYNKHFARIETLSTTMRIEFLENGIIMKNGLVLDSATTADFVPEKKRYSYEEINELINEGKIYPLFARALYFDDEFSEEETMTQNYYDAVNNPTRVHNILKDIPLKIFVPDEIELDRDS